MTHTYKHLQIHIKGRALEVVCRQHGSLSGLWISRQLQWEEVMLVPIAPIGQLPIAGQDVAAAWEV